MKKILLVCGIFAMSLPGSYAGDAADACPRCHLTGMRLPVVYGEPTVEMHQAAQRGEYILGGCKVTPLEEDCIFCRKITNTSLIYNDVFIL